MPAPPKGAVTREREDGVTISVDNGFVAALKAGRFRVVPQIRTFSAQAVHLADGRTLQPDAVICATGYRLGLEGLVGDLGVLDGHGRPRYYADQCSADFPGLWFFGLNASIYGNMYIRRGEARRLARAICSDRPC
jgi:cation diffusion facilitator CzcD-associated flavoprotein CzcO